MGALRAILRQAQVTPEDFLRILMSGDDLVSQDSRQGGRGLTPSRDA